MCVLVSAWMSTMYMHCLRRPEEGIGSFGTRVTDVISMVLWKSVFNYWAPPPPNTFILMVMGRHDVLLPWWECKWDCKTFCIWFSPIFTQVPEIELRLGFPSWVILPAFLSVSITGLYHHTIRPTLRVGNCSLSTENVPAQFRDHRWHIRDGSLPEPAASLRRERNGRWGTNY